VIGRCSADLDRAQATKQCVTSPLVFVAPGEKTGQYSVGAICAIHQRLNREPARTKDSPFRTGHRTRILAPDLLCPERPMAIPDNVRSDVPVELVVLKPTQTRTSHGGSSISDVENRRCLLREKPIEYMQKNHPESLPRYRG
jgi:hypothetical protein